MTRFRQGSIAILLTAVLVAAGWSGAARADEMRAATPDADASRLVDEVLRKAGGDDLGDWTRSIVDRALERAGETARQTTPGGESPGSVSGAGGTDPDSTAPLPAERHAGSLAGNAAGRTGTAEILIFTSLSVPAASWRQWARDAASSGAPLVLRGVGEGGLPGTAKRIGERLGGAEAGVAIDPRLFRLFGIERVPAVVVVPGGVPPCGSRGCADDPAPPHDRIGGNIGLVAALEAVAEEGDVARDVARGYSKGVIAAYVTQFGHWTQWLHEEGFDMDTIHDGYAASVARLETEPYRSAKLRTGVLFITFLEERGVIDPLPKAPSAIEVWPILGDYRKWMRRNRGVMNTSLDTYQTTLLDLMKMLGENPESYNSTAIRDFVLWRASLYGRASAKTTVTATRSFLQFLVSTGQCLAGIDHAVPSIAGWHLSSTPHFLDEPQIERVIAACSGEPRLRDRAVILLLTRLGLRAGEVANLEFLDIDWAGGRLAITGGKSQQSEWLPLPQDIGAAILAYLERGRPKLASPKVFVTARTPRRPLSRAAVGDIVNGALDRAGIQSAKRGSHLLRHSAATAMLRHGVSLAGVGSVLRHRSLSTTMQYAKVDFCLLREIAQPWAGRSTC